MTAPRGDREKTGISPLKFLRGGEIRWRSADWGRRYSIGYMKAGLRRIWPRSI